MEVKDLIAQPAGSPFAPFSRADVAVYKYATKMI